MKVVFWGERSDAGARSAAAWLEGDQGDQTQKKENRIVQTEIDKRKG